jgi:hypothetical protein
VDLVRVAPLKRILAYTIALATVKPGKHRGHREYVMIHVGRSGTAVGARRDRPSVDVEPGLHEERTP